MLLVPSAVQQEVFGGGGLKVIVHVNGQGGEVCVSSNNEDLCCRFLSSQGTFVFSGSPDSFRACLDGNCQSGTNSPASEPEHVYFSGGSRSSGGFSGGSSNSGGSAYDQGYQRAKADFLNGDAKNPRCDPNTTDEFCTLYRVGYEAGWAATWLLRGEDRPTQ